MSEPIVRVEAVGKTFPGGVRALDGLSLSVEPGTVHGLLGPNGAGKTTLVRVLTTLLTPDQGRVRIAGLDVRQDAAAVRSVIGLAGQYAAVDDYLTGRENVEMIGRLYGLRPAESRRRATDMLERIGLAEAAGRQVKTYSGGMRRRLDLAASLVGRPLVLLLDEPSTGLDPASRRDLWELIRGLVRDGTTVLLTTQYLDEADKLADRITVIDAGRVISDGTPDELKTAVGRRRWRSRSSRPTVPGSSRSSGTWGPGPATAAQARSSCPPPTGSTPCGGCCARSTPSFT